MLAFTFYVIMAQSINLRDTNEFFRSIKGRVCKHSLHKTDTAAMITGSVVCLLVKLLPSESTSSKQTKHAAKAIRKVLNLDSLSKGESKVNDKTFYMSVGLALFFAYKNTAKYKGHFIDFCGNSQIHELDLSKDLWDNYNLILNSSRDTNTNVDSVFKALLDSAIKHKISQKDLPKYLIIISDMEFDACSYDDNEVNFNSWKKRFKENAYELPIIVFWNAANRNNISPAQKNDSVIMLSGRSQNGFKTLNLIEKCGIIKPEELAFEKLAHLNLEQINHFKFTLIF